MVNKEDVVVVLVGGPSHESDVSRNTGIAIATALKSIGYTTVLMEYHPKTVLADLKKMGAKVVFIAVHGKYGEDGTIQGVLELAGIPYTGSGVTSSAITMDKIMTARIFKGNGIRMAYSRNYHISEGISSIETSIKEKFTFPMVLKPACEGSTIGIEIVHMPEDLSKALEGAFRVEDRILVEKYIQGEEFTVPVFEGEAWPIIQICPHSGAYDFHSKYTKGATDYIVPALISEELSREIKEMAVQSYRLAECAGVVRFDFRTDKTDTPFLLEANSIPGMTATSLVPKSAKEIGIEFPELCEKILQTAGTGKV